MGTDVASILLSTEVLRELDRRAADRQLPHGQYLVQLIEFAIAREWSDLEHSLSTHLRTLLATELEPVYDSIGLCTRGTEKGLDGIVRCCQRCTRGSRRMLTCRVPLLGKSHCVLLKVLQRDAVTTLHLQRRIGHSADHDDVRFILYPDRLLPAHHRQVNSTGEPHCSVALVRFVTLRVLVTAARRLIAEHLCTASIRLRASRNLHRFYRLHRPSYLSIVVVFVKVTSSSTDVWGHYTPLQWGHCSQTRATTGLQMTTTSFSLDPKWTTALICKEIVK